MALPTVTAARVDVRNLDAGTTYYTKGTGTKVPASLTKWLTAHVLLQQVAAAAVSLDDTVTIAAGDIEVGTGADLQSGDVISYRELLYALMLSSSNTAASVIAREIGDVLGGAGGETEFVSEMATQAAALGMSSSSFLDPHGLSTSSATTPDDLALVMGALKDNATLADVMLTGRRRITLTRSGSPTVVTADHSAAQMSWASETGVTWAKGGFLSGTIYNASVIWEAPNGQRISIVLLDCADDASRLADLQAIIAQLPTDYPALATPAVPLTPSYLFNTLGVSGAYWSGADTAHMWQDTGKTTAVASSSDPVAVWEPEYATVSSLAWTRISSDANRGTWQTDKVTLDGTNDCYALGTAMGTTGLFADSGEEFLALVRFEAPGTDATSTVLARCSATNGNKTLQLFWDNASSVEASVYVRGTGTNFTEEINDSNPHVVGAMWDAATCYHVLEGVPRELQVGTAAEETTQQITLGCRTHGSPASFMQGSVYSVLLLDESVSLDLLRRISDMMRGADVNAFADPAGGAVFQASWAKNANILIGIGA